MCVWLNVYKCTYMLYVLGHMHAWNHICFLGLGWRSLTFVFNFRSLVVSKRLSRITGVCWAPWTNEHKGIEIHVKHLVHYWYSRWVLRHWTPKSLYSPFLFLHHSTQLLTHSSLPKPSRMAIAAISFLAPLSTGALPHNPCLLLLLLLKPPI